MRLLTRSKIYRAFPELDGYSDERCRRFVRAARRPWAFRLPVWALSPVFCALVAWAIVLVGYWRRWGTWPARIDDHVLLYRGSEYDLIAGIVLGGLAMMVARDLALRWRIHHVLRTRGVCPECGYSLVSVEVRPNGEATCTECGYVTLVDASLAELVADHAGRVRYQPRPDSMYRGPRWWTPARRARVRKWSLRACFALAAACALSVGGYFVFLEVQSRAARAGRPGWSCVEAFVTASREHTHTGAGESGDQTDGVANQVARLAAPSNAADTNSQRQRIAMTCAGLWQPDVYAAIRTPEQETVRKATQARAIELLTRLESSDAHAQVRSLLDTPVGFSSMAWDQTLPLFASQSPQSLDTGTWMLVNIELARMKWAMNRGDKAAFADALDLAVGLGDRFGREPLLPWWNLGDQIHGMVLDSLIEMATRGTPEWFDDIAKAGATRVEPAGTMSRRVEGLRLVAKDFAGWIFEDPSRCRWGSRSMSTWALPVGAPDPGEVSLGTWWSNQREINAKAQSLLEALKSDRYAADFEAWERTILPPHSRPQAHAALWLVYTWQIQNANLVISNRLKRDLLLATIEVSRFKSRTGHYPASLDELGPSVLKDWPLDPFTGRPMCYRLERPGDRYVTDYAIYSASSDGVDDGGQFSSYAGTMYWNTGAYYSRSPNHTDLLLNPVWKPTP